MNVFKKLQRSTTNPPSLSYDESGTFRRDEQVAMSHRVAHSDAPHEVTNFRMLFAVVSLGLLGASRGVDEGVISGIESQPAWLRLYDIKDKSSAQSNVVSMVQIGCVLGAILGFFSVDWIGRLRTAQLCTLIWITGTIIWITSTQGGAAGLAQMYAGRFIAGTGIGMTAVCCPMFLSEVAPKSRRGMAVNIFAFSVYIGILLGYFTNYGCQRHIDPDSLARWQIPVSLNFTFAGLSLFGSFVGVKESPRWLLKKGKMDEALKVLAYYRKLELSHPYMIQEWSGMVEQNEKEQIESNGSLIASLGHLFTSSTQVYRLLMVGIAVQILSNWSGGGGSLSIYAPKLFALVGVKSNSTLFTTGIFGVVKLLSAMTAAVFLIDRLGRRRSVFLGISLQAIAALYLSIYLGIVKDPLNDATSASREHAGVAAIVAIFIAGIGWTLGFNAISYLIGTEIFPVATRALATSIIMVFHFVNQYGASRALQPMVNEMSGAGLFGFNAGVCVLSLVWVKLFIPETSNRSLEEMDELFKNPWRALRAGKDKGKIDTSAMSATQESSMIDIEVATPSHRDEQITDKDEEKEKHTY